MDVDVKLSVEEIAAALTALAVAVTALVRALTRANKVIRAMVRGVADKGSDEVKAAIKSEAEAAGVETKLKPVVKAETARMEREKESS